MCIAKILTAAIGTPGRIVVMGSERAHRNCVRAELRQGEATDRGQRAGSLDRNPDQAAVVDRITCSTVIGLILAEDGAQWNQVARNRGPRPRGGPGSDGCEWSLRRC